MILLGQVFQSIGAWQKLAAISMKAGMAYKILKYIREISDEHAIAEKQRVAIIHEITGTKDGEDARIDPESPEFVEYAKRFNAVLATESDLKPLDLCFAEVVDAVDEKDESLSAQDLAMWSLSFTVPFRSCRRRPRSRRDA